MEQVAVRTVAETVAGNIRAFRQLRGLEQGGLARRMQFLGIRWRQVTVSEIERNHRNVTVAELLALALTLDTTIEQLVDPRGPERIRGPWLGLWESDPAGIDAIPPQYVTGLVCTHEDRPLVKWDDVKGTVTLHQFGEV